MRFTKAHGLGNDFILVSEADAPPDEILDLEDYVHSAKEYLAEAEAEVGAALDEEAKGGGLAVVRGALGGGAHLRGAYGARARVEGGDVAGVGLVQESAKLLNLTCRRELHDELTSPGLARAGEGG